MSKLSNRQFGAGLNVLAIGAHPDDIELGCGGALWLSRQRGLRLFGLTLTDGSFTPPGVPPRNADLRRREALRGARTLDISLQFGNLKDRHASVDAVHACVLAELSTRPIHVIFSHLAGHGHSDHDAVAHGVAAALRSSGSVCLHLGFEIPLLRYAFRSNRDPNCFVAVDDSWDRKLLAISQHQSELRRKRVSLEEVEDIAVARARGMHPIKCGRAEAFVVHGSVRSCLSLRDLFGERCKLQQT